MGAVQCFTWIVAEVIVCFDVIHFIQSYHTTI